MTISVIGGWFALAKAYCTREPFNGAKWRMQSGQMRWRLNYNNVLTIGASPEGLYLASIFLFSVYARSAPCSLERDQGAKEKGLGIRICDLHDGIRVGNPSADSREVGGEAARVGWNVLDQLKRR